MGGLSKNMVRYVSQLVCILCIDILYTGKYSPLFYFRPFPLIVSGRIQNDEHNSLIVAGMAEFKMG